MNQGVLSRRGLIRVLGGGTAAAVLGRGTTGRARATDGNWRQYRHDSRNSGDATGHDVPSVGLLEDWRFEGEGLRFAPTVADGVIYVTDEAGVHALDAATGSRKWSTSLGPVPGPTTVLQGTVFTGTEEGTVHALDAGSGEERWQFDAERDRRIFAPTVVGDYLYAGGDRLYALSPIDGSEQWTFETRGPVGLSPAVVDGTVYVGDFAGKVYAVDATQGSLEWSTEQPEALISPPAVADGTLYFGGDEGGVYALAAADGSREWQASTGDFVSAPAVTTDSVYVKSGGVVHAFSAADGTERWRREVKGEWSNPAVVGDTVYVGGDRQLYSLAVEDGTVLGEFEARGGGFRSPVPVDGAVYVTNMFDQLYALSGDVKPVVTGPDWVEWGETVTFSATESVTPADSIEHYEWEIDGFLSAAGSGSQITHTFYGPQSCDVTLWVTDSQGRTARTSHSVFVHRGLLLPGAIGLAGAAGLGTAGLVGARRVGGSNGGGPAADDPSAGTTTDDKTAAEATDSAVDELVDAAETAIAEAERHRAEGDYDAALTQYDEAVQQYFAALNRLPADDDRREELRADREGVESTREALDEQRETHTALAEAVHDAESHFQTAVAGPTSEKLVIPRERYRQANTAYERALDLYDDLEDPPERLPISPDVDIAAPPERLSQFPGVTPAALDVLEDLDVDTLSALRDADAETIEELRAAEPVGDRLTARLVGLHHWADDETVVLEGREALERRASLAADGYQAHR